MLQPKTSHPYKITIGITPIGVEKYDMFKIVMGCGFSEHTPHIKANIIREATTACRVVRISRRVAERIMEMVGKRIGSGHLRQQGLRWQYSFKN